MAEKKKKLTYKELEQSRDDAHSTVAALQADLQQALDQNQLLRNDHVIMRVRVEKFDEILNKIERASYGHAIYYGQYADAVGGATANINLDYPEVRAMPSLSRNERAEQREAQLHKDVRVLSSQITAVNSIVQFAREHKA